MHQSANAPYTLPLSPDAFRIALQKGQGRVLQHVRQYGIADVELAILSACVCNVNYDRQCEQIRAEWLVKILDECGDTDRVVKQLIPLLVQPTDEDYDAEQRCQIACLLAKRGVAGARDAAYAQYRWSGDHSLLIGRQALIALDGESALIRTSDDYGKLPEKELMLHGGSWMIEGFDKERTPGEARRVLEAAFRDNPGVRRFLKMLDDEKRESADGGDSQAKSETRTCVAWSELPSLIQAMKSAYLFQQLSPTALTDEQRTAVVDEVVRSRSGQEVLRLLQNFRLFAQETLDERLLQLLDFPDERVQREAARVLSKYKSNAVRVYAIKGLQSGRYDHKCMTLLRNNYRSGDATLVGPIIQSTTQPDYVHSLGLDLLNLFEKNPPPECEASMLYVYENTPCSMCRESAIDILDSVGLVPTWMSEEFADDMCLQSEDED